MTDITVIPAAAYAGLRDRWLAAELRAYIEAHSRPGPFLYAVLSNDLAAACELADAFSRHRFVEIIEWLRDYAPVHCWGAENTVRMWLAPQIVHALQLGRRQ